MTIVSNLIDVTLLGKKLIPRTIHYIECYSYVKIHHCSIQSEQDPYLFYRLAQEE